MVFIVIRTNSQLCEQDLCAT